MINEYDFVIIGGGISGLYASQQLIKKYRGAKSILVLDERSYFGGRLITNRKPKYEIGGARYNDSHKLLKRLINQYNLEAVNIPGRVDYIDVDKTRQKSIYFEKANESFDDIMKNIIKASSKFSKKHLSSRTLKKFIDEISNDEELSSKLINIFGYNTEFTQMNALNSIETFKHNFVSSSSSSYYVLKDGFSELCNRIVTKLKNRQSNITFKNKCLAVNVENNIDKEFPFTVVFKEFHSNNNKKVSCRNVIFAIKSHQLLSFNILRPIHSDTKCIFNAPLLRIYARYPLQKIYGNRPWFFDLPRITTNSILRHIIPIDPTSGLIMISYTDGIDIEPFYTDKKRMILKSDTIIKSIINTELLQIFPDKTIPQPLYFKTHLWKVGTHHWKPNCNSNDIMKRVRNPLKGCYIVGEAFSNNQAWIEGGLETVEEMISLL